MRNTNKRTIPIDTLSRIWIREIVLYVLVTVGVLASVARCVALERGLQKPNVIIIYTDDQTLTDIGCYGGNVATPHIDSLAREGIRFTRYVASAPVCTASRYNLLTGQYASRSQGLQQQYPVNDHAFIRWNADFVQGDWTLAQVLKRHGYATGMVGKWHNGMGPWDGPHLRDLQRVAPDADPKDPSVKATLHANYDLNTDPQEQNNLATHPQYQSRLRDMQKRLREYSNTTP